MSIKGALQGWHLNTFSPSFHHVARVRNIVRRMYIIVYVHITRYFFLTNVRRFKKFFPFGAQFYAQRELTTILQTWREIKALGSEQDDLVTLILFFIKALAFWTSNNYYLNLLLGIWRDQDKSKHSEGVTDTREAA